MRHGRTIGLIVTAVAVLVLVASLLAGLGEDVGERAELAPDEPPADRVRVEVLNAAGIPGLARDATDRLRSAGFDVVYYGNAQGFSPDSSLVLHRAGREEAARQVADALQIGRVHSRPDTSLYLEATVVIGRDWAGAPPQLAPGPEG
jgi:hypothetical protein